jgi:hypothetical protein
LTALERLEAPAFIAVTGKARTFQPEDGETTYTSVRPESVNEVDSDTRDRWTVGTARHTLDRVAAFADALNREERGEELTTALEADGVNNGLAAGIPLAMDHYGTTPGYLDAIRRMSVEAVEVVAGEREEVTPVEIAPDAGGEANVDLTTDRSVVGVGDSSGATTGTSTGDGSSVATEKPGDAETTGETGATTSGTSGSEATPESDGSEDGREEVVSTVDESVVSTDEPDVVTDELDVADEPDFTPDEPDLTGTDPDPTAEEPGMATDEMYEFDEDEREEIESEFGTEFSTGVEVEEPGESDLDVPDLESDEPPGTEPNQETDAVESETKSPGVTEEPDVKPTGEPDPAGDPETETADEPDQTEEQAGDVDLEDAVVEVMRDLDSGDGADRDAVIEAVEERHGVGSDEIEDAIQDALMSGTCYEPGDGLLKAI